MLATAFARQRQLLRADLRAAQLTADAAGSKTSSSRLRRRDGGIAARDVHGWDRDLRGQGCDFHGFGFGCRWLSRDGFLGLWFGFMCGLLLVRAAQSPIPRVVCGTLMRHAFLPSPISACALGMLACSGLRLLIDPTRTARRLLSCLVSTRLPAILMAPVASTTNDDQASASTALKLACAVLGVAADRSPRTAARNLTPASRRATTPSRYQRRLVRRGVCRGQGGELASFAPPGLGFCCGRLRVYAGCR